MKFSRDSLLALLVAAIVGVGAFVATTGGVAAAAVERITVEDLHRLKAAGVTIVDIRRPEEWRDTGVIDGSHLITAFDADGRLNPRFIDEITRVAAPGEPVALICRSGNRTQVAARLLTEDAGYTNVYDVAGGIRDWVREDRAVTSCPSC